MRPTSPRSISLHLACFVFVALSFAASNKLRAGDLVINDNFAYYANGPLAGQSGWTTFGDGSFAPSVVLSDAPLSGASVARYGMAPANSPNGAIAQRRLTSAVTSGRIITHSLQRIDSSLADETSEVGLWNFDNAGGALTGAGLLFEGDIGITFSRGGLANTFHILGTPAQLMHHWFSIDTTIDLDADTISAHITDRDGTLDQVFSEAIGATFGGDTIFVATVYDSKISLIPEPAFADLAMIQVTLAVMRRRVRRH